MEVEEKESLKVPRYSVPLALVKDRYILTIGGLTAKNKNTDLCEAYDTLM